MRNGLKCAENNLLHIKVTANYNLLYETIRVEFKVGNNEN